MAIASKVKATTNLPHASPELGQEYFDVFYGIDPLAWAFCGFVIVPRCRIGSNKSDRRWWAFSISTLSVN